MNRVALIGPPDYPQTQPARSTSRPPSAWPSPPRFPDFVDVVTFDKLAVPCAEHLTKGREVAVVGKLRLSERTDRDGERRSEVRWWPTPSSPRVPLEGHQVAGYQLFGAGRVDTSGLLTWPRTGPAHAFDSG